MKNIYILISILFCNHVLSFDKKFADFTSEYDQSDFIAKVKITNIELSTNDKGYYDVSIEILSLFKGKKNKKFKISYTPYDDYGLDFTKNSIWLLFASFDDKNVLNREFSYGSIQIDRKMNSKEYPNIEDAFKEKIDRKIALLNFLKKKNIKKINKYNLQISYKDSCKYDLKNYKISNGKFTVFKLQINRDLSIKNIKVLKEFDNVLLSKEMITCFKKMIKIDNSKIKSIETKTDFYLIYYYYKDGEKSFVSEVML